MKKMSIILSTLLLVSFLSGCSTKTNNTSKTNNTKDATTTTGTNKVKVTVGNNTSPNSGSTPIKTVVPSDVSPVNPSASGAKNAVGSISSKKSTAKPSKIPAVKVSNEASFKSAVIVNLSQGKDLAINLNKEYTKDNISDKVIKVVETSGYSGYVSGIQYSVYNNVAYIYFQYKDGNENFLIKSKAVDDSVKAIISKVVTSDMSDYDKELALHDYVVNNVKYDYDNLLKNTIPDDSYTAYGALIKGVAVCEGYAEAINKLLNGAGVTSYIINGLANGVPHEWNLVKIDGGIYHLDATFDDPVSSTEDVITHSYFNVNDVQISKEHTWDDIDYPISTAVAANYFVVNDLLADNKSKYYEIIKNELIKKNPVIDIRTPAYEPDIYISNAILEILKTNKDIDYVDTTLGYSFSYDPDSNVIQIGINYK